MKLYKPTTSGRRGMKGVDYSVLTKKKPEKKLTKILIRRAGRSRGKISVRHRGGGSKRKFRIVDFRQARFGIPAKVLALEYDPSRSAFIALVEYEDGKKQYILAPQDLKVGSTVISAEKSDLEIGNRMKLKNIPIGTQVHNIELYPGKGGVIAKSAGSYATLIAKDRGLAHVELPSTEIRMVPEESLASIGAVSNPEHGQEVLGKAGRSRLRGIRPAVRGTAMNPVDHPHGGGEGRSPIGLKHPKTPWGKPALGVKTRKKRKYSDRFIIRRRQKKKRR